MNKAYFILSHSEARRNAQKACSEAPEGYVVEIKEKTRTLEQNAKLWPMLADISRQVEWYGFRLNDDEWKDFFTAILKQQKVVPNLDRSGFIAVGGRTSNMGKKEFSDLIELMQCFGAEQNVIWSDEILRINNDN